MAFRKFTQCYIHTPGDKPFHIDDLLGFVLGTGAAALISGGAAAFLTGDPIWMSVGMGIATAQILIAVANEWLFHRLVCLNGNECAVGKVVAPPKIGDFGDFDNDEFFDIALLPHHETNEDHQAAHDQELSDHPKNEVFSDGLQGERLLARQLFDLPFQSGPHLHCEAEGDFWVKMKAWAATIGVVVTVASVVGGAIGAALGCAILAFLGPLGCWLGWLIGAAAATALVLYLFAQAAFHGDPGDVDLSNVGDTDAGPIMAGDRVVVFGEHVYDGFHEGWHELHPLMAVMKLDEDDGVSEYLEWTPNFPAASTPPGGLSHNDMEIGLESDPFRARASRLIDRWCALLKNTWDPNTRETQRKPHHRWTIHPKVDGCEPDPVDPPH